LFEEIIDLHGKELPKQMRDIAFLNAELILVMLILTTDF
jgi:hypothetical protein